MRKVKKGKIKGGYTYYRYQYFNTSNGMYHYRIKQIDKDGRFAFSPIQSLLVNSNASNQFKVYPTQVEDVLFIESNYLDVSTEILCFDISGKVTFRRHFSAGIQKMTLPVSQLPASTYILRIMCGDAQFMTRIIKMGE